MEILRLALAITLAFAGLASTVGVSILADYLTIVMASLLAAEYLTPKPD